MRRLVILCVSTLILVGCGASTRELLDRADSLAVEQPDSALKILRMIDSSSLWWENEAHYALVKTTALYKSFAPIESDSLISIAEKYYRLEGNTKMYARAAAFKGIALMEMGLPSEAIYYVKTAEQMTDTADYYMRGWLNLRLAELYQMTYPDNLEDVEKYKTALHYLSIVDPKSDLVGYCYTRLGQLYRLTNIDSAHCYLSKAIELDKNNRDTSGMLYDLCLYAELLETKSDYDQCKSLCLEIVDQIKDTAIYNDVALCLSRVYSKLGQIDSSEFYYSQVHSQFSATDRVARQFAKFQIEKAQMRFSDAIDSYIEASLLSDSILASARKNMLAIAERHYDNSRIEQQNAELNSRLLTRNYAIAFIALIGLVAIGVVRKIMRRKDERAKQYLLLIEQLQSGAVTNQVNFDNLHHDSQVKLRDAMVKRLALIGEMITLSYECKDREKLFAKKFDELIARDPLSSDAYGDILDVVNLGYRNLIDYLKVQYPKINETELLICALTCVGYTSQQLFVILGAKSIETIYNQKYKIGGKLGMNGDLKSSLEKIIETLPL